jgi:predicted neutral ceramidase superfamily lipid hydrolase
MSNIDRTEDCVMVNSKLAISVGLAAAALALVLPNVAGGVSVLGLTFGTALNIAAIALSVAAFTLSWKQRSYLIAGLLATTGIIYMIPGLVALASINFAVIVFPGPILGVIFGLMIFGLGMAKGIRTASIATLTV